MPKSIRNDLVSLQFRTDYDAKWNNRFVTAQTFVDSEVLRGCEPYIPLLTGNLIRSGINGTVIGSGLVRWLAPYAARQYYMPGVGRQTGKLRGGFWFERWKTDHGDETIRMAKRMFR